MKKNYPFKKNVNQFKNESEYLVEEKKEIVELLTEGVFHRENEKYEEALSCYDKVLEKYPNDPVALVNKGGVLVEMKKYEDSLPFLDKVIELKPDLADAYYNKAAALAMIGKVEEALSSISMAIKLNPNFTETAKNDNDFLYIKELPGFSAIVD